MARQRQRRISVYRPRKHGRRWRVGVWDSFTGKTDYSGYLSEAAAKRGYRKLLEEVARIQAPTALEILPTYRVFMQTKGNKESSMATTMARLEKFFSDDSQPICLLDQKGLEQIFLQRLKSTSPDTARNTIAEARTFFRWLVKTNQLSESPAEGIDISIAGRRRKGKVQLRPGEARRFWEHIEKEADGNDGSLACGMALLLGLRQGEITQRLVRDVDRFTRQLYIEEAKTEAGNRVLEIPEALWPFLEKRIQGRQPTELLFPNRLGRIHQKEWICKNARRICKALGLPRVCAHGLRGTHASLAQQAGATGHLVAQQLGHTSEKVTQEHYVRPGIKEEVTRKVALEVLQGGRS